jgi:hypothetical protein
MLEAGARTVKRRETARNNLDRPVATALSAAG